MKTTHEHAAARYRALAAEATQRGRASSLANVHAAHARAADRWEALAQLEDLYLAKSADRASLAAAARAAVVLPEWAMARG
jgi:hypothetical protein